MTHLDLFSGIGGFALAAQTVWGSDYHCVGFCEIDPFCQQVLSKNFPGVQIYGDIRTLSAERLAADTESGNAERFGVGDSRRERTVSPQDGFGLRTEPSGRCTVDLLTGGFPCQPFSTAGKRKGTEDDRFLWPEMLRVIREVKPRWVIGENVAGIIEMALGQVCAELESLGYEVQCFVIPACAINAPHRRDRVWIVGHLADATSDRCIREGKGAEAEEGLQPRPESAGELEGRFEGCDCPSSDTEGTRLEGRGWNGCGQTDARPGQGDRVFPDWSRDWREVAFESCLRGVDDGLPKRLAVLPNGERISESRWRQNALKAYGNAIVPQVAMEIMRAIKAVDVAEVAEGLEGAA